jgi:type 1 glutamine amidotransferase
MEKSMNHPNYRQVLDCASPLALSICNTPLEKRQRAGALQNAIALAAWLVFSTMVGCSLPSTQTDTTKPFRVLVFSKTLGYRHASITNGIAAIRELSSQHGFAVEATEDSSAFTATNLARFQAVVFLSVIGDVLNADQEKAFENYVQGGGGLVAVHAAIFGSRACEGDWAWYGNVIGCAFTNHSAIVPAVVKIEDPKHRSTAGLPKEWQRTDEWYNYTGTPRGIANVLATVDESTYRGGTVGSDHPISWWRPVGQGRMWFTAMGHTESSFSEPYFRQHLLGAIQAVAGRKTTISPATPR